MNESSIEVLEEVVHEINIVDWFRAVPVMLDSLAGDPLFQVGGAALVIGFAFLLAYLLTTVKSDL